MLCFLTTWSRGDTEIDRLGDVWRSIENRTDGDGEDETPRYRLTRVGEEDRLKKSEELEQKAEVEEIEEEQKRPADGDNDLWRMGPLDLLLEEFAIVISVERERENVEGKKGGRI